MPNKGQCPAQPGKGCLGEQTGPLTVQHRRGWGALHPGLGPGDESFPTRITPLKGLQLYLSAFPSVSLRKPAPPDKRNHLWWDDYSNDRSRDQSPTPHPSFWPFSWAPAFLGCGCYDKFQERPQEVGAAKRGPLGGPKGAHQPIGDGESPSLPPCPL